MFANFSNYNWGISNSDLKGMDAGLWKVFSSMTDEIGYVELSEKSDTFQEIPAPKKIPLLKK